MKQINSLVPKKDFGAFLNEYVYLDTSGAMLKPTSVLKAMNNCYVKTPFNPHSYHSPIGAQLANEIEDVRKKVAKLVNANASGVAFTSGTTEALNYIVNMISYTLLEDDEVIISTQEHASNILPWIEASRKHKFKLIFAPGSVSKATTTDDILKLININTKVVSLACMTNIKGSQIDFGKIRAKTGKSCYIICDAAQGVAHMKVDFKKWDIDFLAFSGTKIFGPFGTGALVTKSQYFRLFKPYKLGGGTYASIDRKLSSWTPLPDFRAYEAGTPNSPGIIGLGAALTYFNKINTRNIHRHELELAAYCTKRLQEVPGVTIYSNPSEDINVVFNIEGNDPSDISEFLGNKKILVRSGKQCAPFLYEKINSALRVSFGCYNSSKDVDALVDALLSTEDYSLNETD